MKKLTIQPARLVSKSTSHQLPSRLLVTELVFEVPLDHLKPEGEKLQIFCRGVDRFEAKTTPTTDDEKKPWMVYITGGPGFGCPAPQDMIGLTDEILNKGYKFLCFDHRGMGLSSTVTAATLAKRGSPQQQADYLSFFRADSAVRDLEAIRQCLLADYPDEKKKWSVMGSSYGGYFCVCYVSLHPEGLREAFPIAGMAPVLYKCPDEVIRKLAPKVANRNRKYYAKFPEDRERVKKIVQYLQKENGVAIPSGGRLTAGRFLEIGLHFGFHGGFDNVHAVVLRAAMDLENFGFLTRPTLSQVVGMQWFDDQPLFALLHGSLYAQGQPANWAFDRILKEFPSYALDQNRDEIHFTGEVVLRRAFEDYDELSHLVEVADILEKKTDWPDLYDVEQLKNNEVAVYAASYIDDMYVGYEIAQETSALIKGCKHFITNSLYHDAVRSKYGDLLRNLFALKEDTID